LSGDASWADLLEATRLILRDVADVNRCIWNLGAAPKGFTPVEASMSRARLDLLREADDFVMSGLRRHGLYDDIWQCPTAMVPLAIDGQGQELVVIRPVHSKRAMTAQPAQLPDALLAELRRDILGLKGVSGLALDLTSKPPGTIEWE
jgi:GMP synthase (glutamine-hydrolysing)